MLATILSKGDRMVAMKHQSHPDIGRRLKRAEGHLRSIIAMGTSKNCFC